MTASRRVCLAVAAVALAACGKHDKGRPSPLGSDAAPAVAGGDAAPPPDAAAPTRPVPVEIAAGDHAACAVMSDKTLRCWGGNAEGQVGNGTQTDAPTPFALPLHGVVHVVLGTDDACAQLDDGSVACWGRINFGGPGKLLAPAAVPGVRAATRVFALGAAACATSEDGTLACWGDVDVRGHVRWSGGTPARRAPTAAVGLDHVVAYTANGALHQDGTVSYWGGDARPIKTELTGVTEIASSGDSVCGRLGDGRVQCVGPTPHCAAEVSRPPPEKPKQKARPSRGRRGRRARKKPAPPPAPAGPVVEVLRLPAARHLAFDVGLCVVTTRGQLQCLDPQDGCRAERPWPGLSKVDMVAGHCARSTDGTVRCWEVDDKSRTVGEIRGVTHARQLVSGTGFACALGADAQVVCWGDNQHGQLGQGRKDAGAHRAAVPVDFGAN